MMVIGGQVRPDDWAILRRGQVVGRVYRGAQPHSALCWHWSTLTDPCDFGRAAIMRDALDNIRAAIRARWPDEVGPLPMAGTR